MDDSSPISYLATGVGEQLVGTFYSFVFILVNALIFLIFSTYFSMSALVFVLVSSVAFILIGKIDRWKVYFWFVALFTLFFLDFHLKIVSFILFAVASAVILIFLIKKSEKDYSAPFKLSKDLGKKFFFALPRILFYNISYQLFPLLFIWLGISGFLYYLGKSSLVGRIVSFVFGTVTLTGELTNFVYIMTLSGVVLGFLQFYMQRHEEKVQNKITTHFANQIPWENKFSFDEFGKFLEDEELSELKDDYEKAKRKVDPSGLMEFFKYRRGGEKIEGYHYNIQLSKNDQINQIKFRRLESKAQENNRMDKLKEAYSKFFEKEKKEVFEELDKEEIKKIAWDLLESINILEESFPALSSIKERTEEKPETYEEFLSKTRFEILEKTMSIAIGMH